MNSFKRQVSPGAAVVLVVIVLAIVQLVWYRGLIYKPTGGNNHGPPPGMVGQARPDLVLIGHKYVNVDTLAGMPDAGYIDGPGYIARFDRPTGLALDRAGALYVCDTGNHRIRVVAPNGSVTTIAGSEQGFADGPAAQSKFNAPCGICLSADGAVYVADTGNGRVRRIRDGQVTTIVDLKPLISTLSAKISLPVAIEYQEKPTPHLLVLDAATKSLNQYDMNGKFLSGSVHLDAAVIRTQTPQPSGSGTIAVPPTTIGTPPKTVAAPKPGGAVAEIPILGADELPDVRRRPGVRHLVGWCRIGSGALATDLTHAAVFYVKDGIADVLAGIVPAERPVRDWRDGNGEVAHFFSSTCIVTDGVRYAYVADTGNNCIRRLTLPDFMFK